MQSFLARDWCPSPRPQTGASTGVDETPCDLGDDEEVETASDLRRRRDAHRWMWSAKGDDMYYWEVTDQDGPEVLGIAQKHESSSTTGR
jgi:hypothetical protein